MLLMFLYRLGVTKTFTKKGMFSGNSSAKTLKENFKMLLHKHNVKPRKKAHGHLFFWMGLQSIHTRLSRLFLQLKRWFSLFSKLSPLLFLKFYYIPKQLLLRKSKLKIKGNCEWVVDTLNLNYFANSYISFYSNTFLDTV